MFYVGMTRAEQRLFLTSAARRRVFGEYQATEPSRFLDEVPAELVERITPTLNTGHHGNFAHAHYEFRTNPYSRGGRPARFKEDSPKYTLRGRGSVVNRRARRDARQTRAVRCGCRPRGRGTHGRHRITVRFNSVGQKKLLQKFAKLEPA